MHQAGSFENPEVMGDVALVRVQPEGESADRRALGAKSEEQPVASNSTAAGRQLNRRVEVLFTQ